MDCSCRTVALRTFVRGIAQVHAPLRAAAPISARYQANIYALAAAQPSQFPNQRNPSVPAIAPRGFHTSCARNSAAEAAEASAPTGEDTGRRTSEHPDDSAGAETRHSPKSERSADPSSETETRAPRTDTAGSRPNRPKKEKPTVRPRIAGKEADARRAWRDGGDGDKKARKFRHNKDGESSKDGEFGNDGEFSEGRKFSKDGRFSKERKFSKDGKYSKDGKHNKYSKDGKYSKDSKDKTTEPAADEEPKTREMWMIQKEALKKKFPEGWNPRKKLSPDAMAGIRMLHDEFPKEYTTEALAKKFEVSPEAIRRILKSRWKPTAEEEADRQERWFKRGKSVWTQWAALGKKPPRRWRAEGIVRDPVWNTPRGPTHKNKDERAEAQRRLAWAMKGMEPPPRPAKTETPPPA